MPELPEVEIIARSLINLIKNEEIISIIRSEKKFRIASTLPLELLVGKRIISVFRKAKILFIELSQGYLLIFHLGMSGRIVVNNADIAMLKHDHLTLGLSNGTNLVFNDARRFGFIDLIDKADLEEYIKGKKLGIEPLAKEFNKNYLKKISAATSKPIKLLLMDNTHIVGIGNIYASESLFLSKIHPARPADSIKNHSLLADSIKLVLNQAIEKGGSSLKDFVDSLGNKGSYQDSFLVYGRDKLPCKSCDDSIEKIILGGRSSFYCPSCQKL